MTLAELYEEQGNLEKAVEQYQLAADMFSGEVSKPLYVPFCFWIKNTNRFQMTATYKVSPKFPSFFWRVLTLMHNYVIRGLTPLIMNKVVKQWVNWSEKRWIFSRFRHWTVNDVRRWNHAVRWKHCGLWMSSIK